MIRLRMISRFTAVRQEKNVLSGPKRGSDRRDYFLIGQQAAARYTQGLLNFFIKMEQTDDQLAKI